MKNDINNPLKLTWNGTEYKVNKPKINNLDLVDLSVAKELQDKLSKQTELMDRMAQRFSLVLMNDLEEPERLAIDDLLTEYTKLKEGSNDGAQTT